MSISSRVATLRVALLVACLGVAVGCSTAATERAEWIIEDSLLTTADFPEGEWLVTDYDLQMLEDTLATARALIADDRSPLPPECAPPAGAAAHRWPAEMLTMRGRSFHFENGGRGTDQSVEAVSLFVLVFESAEGADDARPQSDAPPDSEERTSCTDALSDRSDVTFTSRIEEPLLSLSDADSSRRVSTSVQASGETSDFFNETHYFTRGRVVATYMYMGNGETELDHQALLNAFERRVVEAQE